MAKKKESITGSWLGSSTSERHFIVYYVEIDNTTNEPIKPKKEITRRSTEIDAHNALASIYHNGNMSNPEANATFENSTIIQKSERHPNITYKWYIEDEWQ